MCFPRFVFARSHVTELSQAPGQLAYAEDQLRIVLPLFLAGGLYLVLCLIHWFAWSNFRRCDPSARRVAVQVLLALTALGLIAVAIAVAVFVIAAKGTVQLT